jgi:hypothetical protein
MKTLFAILASLGLALSASAAGFVSGPNAYPLLAAHATTNFAYAIPGATLTNITGGNSTIVPVGVNGSEFILKIGGTNSAQVTNLTVTLEPVYVGFQNQTNVIANQTYTISAVLTSGTCYGTNLLPTIANFGNLAGVRIKSINNTNVETLWLSNAVSLIR